MADSVLSAGAGEIMSAEHPASQLPGGGNPSALPERVERNPRGNVLPSPAALQQGARMLLSGALPHRSVTAERAFPTRWYQESAGWPVSCTAEPPRTKCSTSLLEGWSSPASSPAGPTGHKANHEHRECIQALFMWKEKNIMEDPGIKENIKL